MANKLWFLLGSLAFYATCASAQILNFSVSGEALQLPGGFTESLHNCTPYNQKTEDNDKGLSTRMQYKIFGYDENHKCHILIKGSNNNGVKITQECFLAEEDAVQYADALARFVLKKYRPRKSREYDFILNDEDYAQAVAIMENPYNCTFHREAIDNSAIIRRNLANCTPAEQIETNGNLQIKRQIVEKQKNTCHILYKVIEFFAKSDNKNDLTQTEYLYDCHFNEQQKNEFAEILQAGVIAAEDDLDFSAVQRFDSKDEIVFIIEHCELQLP